LKPYGAPLLLRRTFVKEDGISAREGCI